MLKIDLPKHIILFGHRQQHGKDTCCDILKEVSKEKNLDCCHTYFAKLLKNQISQRYNLDFHKMGDDSYKNWCPPWVNPKRIEMSFQEAEDKRYEHYSDENGDLFLKIGGKQFEIEKVLAGGSSFVYLKPRSVRDILIEEGCKAREIWGDAWAFSAYNEIFNDAPHLGIISDYRFPNEFNCFQSCLRLYMDKCAGNTTVSAIPPKIHRVLVHRPSGPMKNDGADGELPDLEDENAWDYVIMNDIEGNNWKAHLKSQILKMLEDLNIS